MCPKMADILNPSWMEADCNMLYLGRTLTFFFKKNCWCPIIFFLQRPIKVPLKYLEIRKTSVQVSCLKGTRVLLKIVFFSPRQRLHELLLPLCVRLQQQQQSNSSVSSDPLLSISGQYSSALTRRELYRCRPHSATSQPFLSLDVVDSIEQWGFFHSR